MNKPSNADDCLIEPCVVCHKPVLVFVKSVILTLDGKRWTYCSLDCVYQGDSEVPYQLDVP